MKNLFKKKRITISCLAICMLTILGSLSTTMSYNNINSNTNEPVAEKEIVNIKVDANQVKQPLAITDNEPSDIEEKTTEESTETIYDESMIETVSDPSIEVNNGYLLEDGGEYIEKPQN